MRDCKKLQCFNFVNKTKKCVKMKCYRNFKEINIVLLSDGTRAVRQFRVPNFLSPVLALFLLSCGAYISWVSFDYLKIKAQIPRLMSLQKENTQQKNQVLHLTRQINQMSQKMDALMEITDERKASANPDPGDNNSYVMGMGMGGSDLDLLQPYLFMVKAQNGQDRLKHGSLDYPNDKIDTEKSAKTEEAVSTKKVVKIGKKEKIQKHLKAVAIELGLDPRLALGMAKVESGYNHKVVSPKGAVGVLQVTPRLAWNDYKITREKLFDPEINIRVGLSWMKYLLKRFDHDLDLSLAAYNAGVSRVVKAGYRIPRIVETRNYVKKVKKAMKEEV